MKSAIYVLLCIAAAAVGAWQMYVYLTTVNARAASGNMNHLIISVVCIIAALAFGGFFLAGRINKEEELHITK